MSKPEITVMGTDMGDLWVSCNGCGTTLHDDYGSTTWTELAAKVDAHNCTSTRIPCLVGRRSGKNARMSELVAQAEAAGHWVVVASKRGMHCSRCQRWAEECRGTCMDTPG